MSILYLIVSYLFGKYDYGVGDSLPQGKKLSQMDSPEVARSRNIIEIFMHKEVIKKISVDDR